MDLLATPARRRLLFAALYFSEGAPIGFIWWYLPTHLRLAGVPVDRITQLTALLVMPWTFKFVWAPLLDGFRRRGVPYRRWAMTAQAGMALALVPLLVLDPVRQFPWMVASLLLHSLCAATQDVAIDGLAINATPEGQRGGLNGWMQTGMLTGRSLFGGVALAFATHWDVRVVPAALVVAVAMTMTLLAFTREPATSHDVNGPSLGESLRRAVRGPLTWLGIGFALVSGAGFEAVGAVVGPFLVDRGETREAIGRFLAVPALVATILGSLAGGWASDRFRRERTLAVAQLALAGLIVWLALQPALGSVPRFQLLTALYLAIGVFTAASYALFMDLTDPRLGATQFSTYMAATNACEAWAGFTVGALAARWGYGTGFLALAAASLVALPLLVPIARGRVARLREPAD